MSRIQRDEKTSQTEIDGTSTIAFPHNTAVIYFNGLKKSLRANNETNKIRVFWQMIIYCWYIFNPHAMLFVDWS